MDSLRKNVPCVYFISDGQGHCKIGVASDLEKRLSALQVGSAYELSVIHAIYTEAIDDAYVIESEYHAILGSKNIRGEWFDEQAVKYYLSGLTLEGEKFLCDEIEDFNICELMEMCMVGLQMVGIEKNTSPEEYIARCEAKVPGGLRKYKFI